MSSPLVWGAAHRASRSLGSATGARGPEAGRTRPAKQGIRCGHRAKSASSHFARADPKPVVTRGPARLSSCHVSGCRRASVVGVRRAPMRRFAHTVLCLAVASELTAACTSEDPKVAEGRKAAEVADKEIANDLAAPNHAEALEWLRRPTALGWKVSVNEMRTMTDELYAVGATTVYVRPPARPGQRPLPRAGPATPRGHPEARPAAGLERARRQRGGEATRGGAAPRPRGTSSGPRHSRGARGPRPRPGSARAPGRSLGPRSRAPGPRSAPPAAS